MPVEKAHCAHSRADNGNRKAFYYCSSSSSPDHLACPNIISHPVHHDSWPTENSSGGCLMRSLYFEMYPFTPFTFWPYAVGHRNRNWVILVWTSLMDIEYVSSMIVSSGSLHPTMVRYTFSLGLELIDLRSIHTGIPCVPHAHSTTHRHQRLPGAFPRTSHANPRPSVPRHPSSRFPPTLRPIALVRIHSLLGTASSTSPSGSFGITSLPSKRFSSTSSSGREKYTTLYLAMRACSPGGGTTRWRLERKRPFVNLTMASPRFTMAWDGSGRT